MCPFLNTSEFTEFAVPVCCAGHAPTPVAVFVCGLLGPCWCGLVQLHGCSGESNMWTLWQYGLRINELDECGNLCMRARIGCIIVYVSSLSACSLWRGSSERVSSFETRCGEGNVPALHMIWRCCCCLLTHAKALSMWVQSAVAIELVGADCLLAISRV